LPLHINFLFHDDSPLSFKNPEPIKARSRVAPFLRSSGHRQGESWVDPQFRDLVPELKPEPVRRRHRAYESPDDDIPQWSSLTPRERQIASLVAQGHRYKEIAKTLQISAQTVRNHLRNIFEKLQINDRVQLALFTLQRIN